ncbi:hypothetical protein B0J14DRAFT_466945 [Halenospora varia]|nr:hypothetical protein B0J14DRAFT_466945 [Halenospora varia]
MTRQRGLAYSHLAFPTGHPDRAGYHTGLVIIGRNSSDFENNTRWKELKASIKRATKQEVLAAAQEEERRKQMARQVLEMTGKGKEWDVRGKYSIKLPAIEKGWNVSDLTMEIFTEKRSGTPQMFAKFNFLILKGVMRFERQKDLTAKKDKKPDSSRKRKRELNSEDEDEYNRDRRSPTPDEFYLSPVTLPSKQHCTWTYRWRGEETGEGEIQARSEHNAYSITFLDPRGTKIKGTFGSEYFSDDEFTGVKIRPGRDSSIDISDEWAEGNEASYDRRCRGRWH